jgi:hypothetical protein
MTFCNNYFLGFASIVSRPLSAVFSSIKMEGEDLSDCFDSA